MSDHALIERLRCGVATYDDMADAADRIEAQAAEIARLRAACDASEERERAIELRFWQTVDRNGLTGLPSDMWAALEQLTQDRAELATARREGMEEAAQIAEKCTSRGHEGYDGTYNRGINTGTMQAKADIAAAIRAAAKEGKP